MLGVDKPIACLTVQGSTGGAGIPAAAHWKGTDMKRITKLLHLAALTGAAVVYLSSTQQLAARSQPNCGPRDAVLAQLAERYGETRRSIGIGSNNAVVETFASDETGSWTILVTLPSGLTCLVASGQSFEHVVEALPSKGSDA
ncbi:hypothetical protein Z949_527 [Sulfitobacter guttiformis KCTC 32187]|nr:hypothetical protein Z949_527 [Sulfitobacter guttiformis KCTC 32187]